MLQCPANANFTREALEWLSSNLKEKLGPDKTDLIFGIVQSVSKQSSKNLALTYLRFYLYKNKNLEQKKVENFKSWLIQQAKIEHLPGPKTTGGITNLTKEWADILGQSTL